jgi:hypothetical protein
VVPGINPTGAVVGAVWAAWPRGHQGKQYYRDTRGYCHYVDQTATRSTIITFAANGLAIAQTAGSDLRLVEHSNSPNGKWHPITEGAFSRSATNGNA